MPDTTETVTLSGAADIIGCSRQWAHHLASTDAVFPRPVLTTESGRRWSRVEIETYAAQRKADAT